jgi:hypothetical protein
MPQQTRSLQIETNHLNDRATVRLSWPIAKGE